MPIRPRHLIAAPAVAVGALAIALACAPMVAAESASTGGAGAREVTVAGPGGAGAYVVAGHRSEQAGRATSSEPWLRVLTWNIHQGYTRPGLPAIAERIRDTGASVVGLNEVLEGQAPWLARHAGFRYVRFDAVYTKSTGRRLGNAVLSKYPIVATRTVALPHATTNCSVGYACEPRGVLQTEIAVHGSYLWFDTTHLNPGAYRVAQARRAVAAVNARSCATILVGDMNSVPGSETYRVLAAHDRDVFHRLHPGLPGRTSNAQGTPRYRIDYVFSHGLRPVASWVTYRSASDHLGVVASFRIPAGSSCTPATAHTKPHAQSTRRSASAPARHVAPHAQRSRNHTSAEPSTPAQHRNRPHRAHAA